MNETQIDDDAIIALLLIAYLCNEDKGLLERLKTDNTNSYPNNITIPYELKILGNENYKKFNQEVEEYTQHFISANHCHKYMPHTEFKEYYEGLNIIRLKYGLGKLIQMECKCGGYGYMVDENKLKEKDNEKED